MVSIDMELFKKHVRADDFNDDDDYLYHLVEAAEEYVVNATQRPISELLVNDELPKPLQQAVLLIAGHWYNQREAVASAQMSEVPYTLQALIRPYRKLK